MSICLDNNLNIFQMMEIEMVGESSPKVEGRAEEENLYSRLQELNKYLEFLNIQEEYIKEDQIKLKRYPSHHAENNSAPRKNLNASKPYH